MDLSRHVVVADGGDSFDRFGAEAVANDRSLASGQEQASGGFRYGFGEERDGCRAVWTRLDQPNDALARLAPLAKHVRQQELHHRETLESDLSRDGHLKGKNISVRKYRKVASARLLTWASYDCGCMVHTIEMHTYYSLKLLI